MKIVYLTTLVLAIIASIGLTALSISLLIGILADWREGPEAAQDGSLTKLGNAKGADIESGRDNVRLRDRCAIITMPESGCEKSFVDRSRS